MTSLIIPTYNEEAGIVRTLEQLRQARGSFEVIVVDGESTDATRTRAEFLIPDFPRPLRVIAAESNRALQLNRGAQVAHGETLLFLHADALFPPEAIEAVEAALEEGNVVGGNFSLEFEDDSRWGRFFTWVNRVRRTFGIYYGDSALFVRRDVFARLGGFKPIPIMEDYEFVRRMEKAGRTVCLPPVLRVSDRRWRLQGVLRTMWCWFWIQTLYSLGVPPKYLARWYRPVRAKGLVGRKEAWQKLRSTGPSAENVSWQAPAATVLPRRPN